VNEFDFIRQLREQIRSRQRSPRLSVGIGDDAAVIRQYSDRDFVLTTDLLVEGIDFHPQATPPQLLGHKALAVSLSDIAAMGARPRWALLSVGLCQDRWQSSFKDELFAGYLALADRYGVTLAGGDVSASRQIVIDSILVGEVMSGRATLRSTARPGDQIFVTGSLGGAAAGLKLIELGARIRRREDGPTSGAEATSDEDEAIHSLLLRQLSPQPRVGWGIVLGEEQLATSMIDISDGLSSDLHHLCDESKAGATIDAATLPLDGHVVQLCGRRALDPLALALHGGEDFELLFTVAPENVARLPKRVDDVPISRIGEVTAGPSGVRLHEKNLEWELKPQGFQHFGD
jgi:thiamine-monophosphate kinase